MKPAQAPRRILVIRTDRLGETLLNLPILVALKRAFPSAFVTWMVNPALVELLRDAPGVDQVIGYRDERRLAWWMRALHLARRLRGERFDLVLISNCKKEFHAAAWLAGIPQRVGYDRKWGGLLTHRIPDRKALGERHELEYNLELLNALQVAAPPAPALQLSVSKEAEAQIVHLLQSLGVMKTDRLVAIHPWTSNPTKQWPVERFSTLITRLTQLAGVRPVLIGGPEDQARASELMQNQGDRVLSVVGRLSLTALAALLQKARLLLSNDSGPGHLAAAVGTPTVVLFGTTDPATGPTRWGPWGAGHTVIWKPAMEAIEVDEVLHAVQQYL